MNLDIFTEAFLSRALPMFHEVTLGAIRHLQFELYPQNAVLAGAGALTASAMLYLLGVWLRCLPEKFSTEEQRARIERTRARALEWLPWLLVLAPLPVGGTIIIVAGFFRLRPAVAAFALIASEILWRAMPYLR